MKSILRIFNFIFLATAKIISQIFYWFDRQWVHPSTKEDWKNIRMGIFLNHTSLMEFIFVGAGTWGFLWQAAGRLAIPAADTTMQRPIIGPLISLFSPKIVPISRKRDETWEEFKSGIDDQDMVFILPEGRMMRGTGLDKNGKPMSVKAGVADLLKLLGNGGLVIAYSGGLHHIQIPDTGMPKLFKTARIRLERLEIEDYIREIENQEGEDFKAKVIADLEARMKKYCPIVGNSTSKVQNPN